MSFPPPPPNWLCFHSLDIHSGHVTGSSHPSKFKSVQHLHLRLWQPRWRAVLHRQHFFMEAMYFFHLFIAYSQNFSTLKMQQIHRKLAHLFLLLHTKPMFDLDGHNLGRTLNLKRGFIWVLPKAQSHRQCPGVKK